ncbi:Conidiation-specific protein 6 [Grifola frondosa]|uniref:Conidiation-specific protein 6 n=1 Tax=Grifola frondosa TaxID=5627 RepID=A0A1C7LND1_GRIFR|nr:Conidiation-specific protein 6 [Grifola frondosa]
MYCTACKGVEVQYVLRDARAKLKVGISYRHLSLYKAETLLVWSFDVCGDPTGALSPRTITLYSARIATPHRGFDVPESHKSAQRAEYRAWRRSFPTSAWRTGRRDVNVPRNGLAQTCYRGVDLRIQAATNLSFKPLPSHTRSYHDKCTMASYGEKDPDRVAAGLKATITNPRTSDAAKERAAGKLEHMNPATLPQPGPESNRVLGGYKATLHNEHASEEAKRHAREVLEAAGYTVERAPNMSEDEHHRRVIAGYKAALHNPRVSDAAKQHAMEFLNQSGVM